MIQPSMLVLMPVTGTHNEQLDRWLGANPILSTFEKMIVPAKVPLRIVAGQGGGGSEFDLARKSFAKRAMHPRSDQQPDG